MVLVDTSIWVDHLRAADARLVEQLLEGQVACHPFVIGELACGTLKQRAEILALLKELPQVPVVTSEHMLVFLDVHALMGKGLGWVAVHLLASAYISGHRLWTRDKRLAEAARRLGLAR